MARKRKTLKGIDPLSILPIHYTKRDFEERKKTIISFTNAIRSRNRNVNQYELSREDVAQQYTLTLFREYTTEDPKYFELLGQLESPACSNYWGRLAPHASGPKNMPETDRSSFWITDRGLPPSLVERYPHRITLEHKKLGLVVIPNIALYSIDHISYQKTIESIFEANVEIDSLHLYVRQIWNTVIRVVYHFEDSAAQDRKLEEMDALDFEMDNLVDKYRLSHKIPHSNGALGTTSDLQSQTNLKSEVLKRNKRRVGEEAEQEQDEDEMLGKEEARQRRLSNKRQKHRDTVEGKWQEIETELDLAGAAMSELPVPLQFANTDLPLRFKS